MTELNIEAGRWNEGMFRIAEAWGKPESTGHTLQPVAATQG